ncbi:uncharacterized protein LOC141898315 [Tubulanus polymorphus]|uniref:uncharacterized protein LOC141898315 n=1 Tax=Tubulanus polymorphus TaxID=672921 RepID=UPI003DA23AA5
MSKQREFTKMEKIQDEETRKCNSNERKKATKKRIVKLQTAVRFAQVIVDEWGFSTVVMERLFSDEKPTKIPIEIPHDRVITVRDELAFGFRKSSTRLELHRNDENGDNDSADLENEFMYRPPASAPRRLSIVRRASIVPWMMSRLSSHTPVIAEDTPPERPAKNDAIAFLTETWPVTPNVRATTSFELQKRLEDSQRKRGMKRRDSMHYKLILDSTEPKMRIFVSFGDERASMDIPHGKTVADVKVMVQDKFFIRPNNAATGDMETAKNILVLSYGGAELGDEWILTDIGVNPGSTIRAFLKEERNPILYIYCVHNRETLNILERIKIREMLTAELRTLASKKTGLPVGVFRLVTKDDREMYDVHGLDEYDIQAGDTINLETWDGWNDFLTLAVMGFTDHMMAKLSADEFVARYQMKVAMYIAAHFGHVDLAISLMKQGIRHDEPVGQHPYRQWCLKTKHVDSFKCPVHEATENGQLGVLRAFVHNNVCTVMTKDGNGLRPLNIALRQKHKHCAQFLLTKQWSRIAYSTTSVPLSLYAKMRAWGERAKERTLLIYGLDKSSLKRRPEKDAPLVGQGVYVDGFSECQMQAKSKAITRFDIENRKILNLPPAHLDIDDDDPEGYFRRLLNVNVKLPRIGRLNKSVIAGLKSGKSSIIDDKASDRSGHSESSTYPMLTSPTDELDDSVRLPPIKERRRVSQSQQNLSYGNQSSMKKSKSQSHQNLAMHSTGSETSELRPNSPSAASMKSNYLETGKLKPNESSGPKNLKSAKSMSDADGRPKKRQTKSAALLVKAKSAEYGIPLPMNSVDSLPKPFYHVGVYEVDDAQRTLDQYEKYRGMKSRDYAIKCLSVANTFKEKPWLHQVRLAMTLTTQKVKKSLDGERSVTLSLVES